MERYRLSAAATMVRWKFMIRKSMHLALTYTSRPKATLAQTYQARCSLPKLERLSSTTARSMKRSIAQATQ
jgi:hypothetical protein